MRAPIVAILFLAVALPAVARQQAVAAPRLTGFRAEFIADLDEVQEKIEKLAAAVPAGKYGWRPAAGIRSVSEVYMHIAGGNYFLPTFVGQQPPPDMPKDIETIDVKATVIAELKKSFDHVRRVIANESDADLDKSVNMFGKPATHRYVFTTMLNHLHEHLGQSIAYARMNGVAPPWSR
ncbi:MAG TPA: DinB family protein [Thermoanaerobaculia bacterium]|jgi:uncharacterized damage-inducible protein DinB|nr:DinB family protein [Thermoanaerobaculia bacterium]